MGAVVVLAGGVPHAHDYPAIGASIADLVRRNAGASHAVDLIDHPAHLVERLASRPDVLVVDALFWQMSGDAYDPWREAWAYSPPDVTRAAITQFVSDGGGLVALHTASICFDDWPEWGDIVGGSWRWGISSHPPVGQIEVRVVSDHPITAGVGATFELHDEVYGDLSVRPHVEVLAVAKRTADDVDQPILWAHRYGRGRVVYNGFGHDVASIEHPVNSQILTQAVHWVRGET